MAPIAQAPSSVALRWPMVLISGLVSLGVAVVVQPVVQSPPLALVLLVTLTVLLVLLVRLRSLRRWSHLISACVGVVAAVMAYLVLWVIAAPTGFPSGTFGSPDAPITLVYADPGSTRLEVGVGTCLQDPQVTAVETADEVRLSSNEKLPRGDSGDCADSSFVILAEPLGDRTVLDEATGKVVEVLPAE